jgi:hypothetical protein
MGRVTKCRVSAGKWLLGALAVSACGPSAIPLHSGAPAEGIATINETDGFIVDEDGHVEITRVDDTPVPTGSSYQLSAGKHKVELIRNSPTKASSAETYFLKAGGKYVAWNGCAIKTVEKDGKEEEKRVCDQQPQLLPTEALHCYQTNDRTSSDCKAATDEWSESDGNE